MLFQIQSIVLSLLEDSQPEVRVKAAKVLSGLLHCQFILEPMELLVSDRFQVPQYNMFIFKCFHFRTN